MYGNPENFAFQQKFHIFQTYTLVIFSHNTRDIYDWQKHKTECKRNKACHDLKQKGLANPPIPSFLFISPLPSGAVVFAWKLDWQLNVQSVPITTNVVSSSPRLWWGVLDTTLRLLVTCGRSVVFSWYSDFLYQSNWLPQYNWNIVEGGLKYYTLNPFPLFFLHLLQVNHSNHKTSPTSNEW